VRIVLIYRDDSEHARPVIDFLRDFERHTGHTIETMEPDSPEGIDFCRAYDIVEYPTMVAVSDDGQAQNMWRGVPLPTISEVSYYAG
jgi:hypothetical protein